MPINLVEAKEQHLLFAFKLANDKETIKNSILRKKITLEQHTIWFKRFLNSKNKIFKIIYLNKNPIGLIRLEKKYRNYYLSYSIDPRFRRRGYASLALLKFIKKIKMNKKIKKIIALVKKKNTASIKIFNKLNFIDIHYKKKIFKFEYKI